MMEIKRSTALIATLLVALLMTGCIGGGGTDGRANQPKIEDFFTDLELAVNNLDAKKVANLFVYPIYLPSPDGSLQEIKQSDVEKIFAPVFEILKPMNINFEVLDYEVIPEDNDLIIVDVGTAKLEFTISQEDAEEMLREFFDSVVVPILDELKAFLQDLIDNPEDLDEDDLAEIEKILGLLSLPNDELWDLIWSSLLEQIEPWPESFETEIDLSNLVLKKDKNKWRIYFPFDFDYEPYGKSGSFLLKSLARVKVL